MAFSVTALANHQLQMSGGSHPRTGRTLHSPASCRTQVRRRIRPTLSGSHALTWAASNRVDSHTRGQIYAHLSLWNGREQAWSMCTTVPVARATDPSAAQIWFSGKNASGLEYAARDTLDDPSDYGCCHAHAPQPAVCALAQGRLWSAYRSLGTAALQIRSVVRTSSALDLGYSLCNY